MGMPLSNYNRANEFCHSEEREVIVPERALLAAIIGSAVHDYIYGSKEWKRSAWRFLFSNKKEKVKWSFRWMCVLLDFDADEMLATLKEQRVKMGKRRVHRRRVYDIKRADR